MERWAQNVGALEAATVKALTAYEGPVALMSFKSAQRGATCRTGTFDPTGPDHLGL